MPKRSRDSTEGSTTDDGVDFTAPIGAALTSASARAALAALSADDQAAVLQVLASASTFDVAALAAACVPHAVVPAVVAARVVAPHLPQSALPAATTAQLAQLLPFLWQVAFSPAGMAHPMHMTPFPCPARSGALVSAACLNSQRQPFIGNVPAAVDVLLEVAFTTPSVKSLSHDLTAATSDALHRHIVEVDMEACGLESLKLAVPEDFAEGIEDDCPMWNGADQTAHTDAEVLQLQFRALAMSPLRQRLRTLGLSSDNGVSEFLSSVDLRGLATSVAAWDRRTASDGESVCTYEEAMASPLAALFPALECLLLQYVSFPGVDDDDDEMLQSPPDAESSPRTSLGAAPPRLRTVAFLHPSAERPLPFTSGLDQVTALWTDTRVVMSQCKNVKTLVFDTANIDHFADIRFPPPVDSLTVKLGGQDDAPTLFSVMPLALRALSVVQRFGLQFDDGGRTVGAIAKFLDRPSAVRQLTVPALSELRAVVGRTELSLHEAPRTYLHPADWCDRLEV